MNLFDRLKRGWNAFINNRDPTVGQVSIGGYAYRPDRRNNLGGREQSLVDAPLTRIAIDAASIDIKHIKTDDEGKYIEDINSSVNERFTLAANIDQTGRAFRQDIFQSLLDDGCVAIVPIDTDTDPDENQNIQVYSMRVGKIVEWFPQYVRVMVYNERTGRQEPLMCRKSSIAIVENPFYAIMNEPNSTMKRLVHKLNLLDAVDEQSSSGKLDLILQLPYSVRSQTKKDQASERKKELEQQLMDSKYGIAYVDATEKITQLNRPIENNLMAQVEYLLNLFYSQMGITQAIMDGTADEKVMVNYFDRTIEPLVSAVVDALKVAFLTKTARSEHHTFAFFRSPFRLVPVSDIAEIADKFTRNEILSSNEVRQIMGYKPSKDPKADQLVNSNISQPDAQAPGVDKKLLPPPADKTKKEEEDRQNEKA